MFYDNWIKNWRSALAENFFLRGIIILLCAGLILNATVFRENTRIVIVPPTLKNEFWIEKGKASPEYLEQMSVFIATLAGNLSPRNAEYNVESLLGYIDDSRVMEVKDDLKAQALYIKKNNINQCFFPEHTSIDEPNQSVSILGRVTRHIGAIKVSEDNMRVFVRYRFKDYSIKVIELSVDYPKHKAEEIKKEQEAVAPIPGETNSTGKKDLRQKDNKK